MNFLLPLLKFLLSLIPSFGKSDGERLGEAEEKVRTLAKTGETRAAMQEAHEKAEAEKIDDVLREGKL